MSLDVLPTVNALLNGTSALLLVTGWLLIRRRRVRAHRNAMLAAVATSTLFLASYLTYHWFAGTTRFTHPGPIRTFYLSVLLTHTVLAAAVPVLVIITLWHAARSNFRTHRRIARWTLPIWLYVSVTGVVIYLMLYHLYPPA